MRKYLIASLKLTRNGAKILDWRTSDAEFFSPLLCVFWRFVTGPLPVLSCTFGPAMLCVVWGRTTKAHAWTGVLATSDGATKNLEHEMRLKSDKIR
jgi:hypothetical protein